MMIDDDRWRQVGDMRMHGKTVLTIFRLFQRNCTLPEGFSASIYTTHFVTRRDGRHERNQAHMPSTLLYTPASHVVEMAQH